MAQTEKGIVYPYDYNEVADVPADLKALAESIDALFNDYSLVTDSGNKIVLELNNSTYKIKVILKDKDDNVINTSNEIDLPIENMITNIAYNNQKLVITHQDGQITEVSIADLVSGLASEDAVEELQSQIDDLTTLIETELDSNTVEGTEIDVSDSAEYRGKIDVKGNTEQRQLSGKNLLLLNTLEPQTINGVTFTPVYDEKGLLQYINVNGTSTGLTRYFIVSASNNYAPVTDFGLEYNTPYYLSGGKSNSTTYLELGGYMVANIINYSGDKEITFADDSKYNMRIVVPQDVTLNNEKIYPMFRLQTVVDNTYEPYCGGQPSPSTDYPQEIENVEGRSCRNLFNIPNGEGTIRGVAYVVENQQLKLNGTISGGYPWLIMTKNSVSAVNGTPSASTIVEKIDGIIASGIVKATSYIIGGTARVKPAFNIYDMQGTVITQPTEQTQVGAIAIYLGATGETFENLILGFQINEGSTALPYEPYFEGKRLEFNVCNKQLFDKNNANILNTAVDANGLGNNSPTTYRTVYIPCKPNTTYTVSKLFDQTKNRFTVAYTKETPNYRVQTYGTIYNSTGYTITITTGADAKYLVAYIWLNGGSTTPEEMINSIQIEERNTATPYEEHKEQMIPFPLQEGQKLMEGDYLADDGVHHMRGQVVLDGSQDISKFNYNSALSTTDYNCFFFSDNSIKQASNDTDVFVIADKLLGTPASQRTSNKLNCWINHLAAHLLGIHVPNTITDTTELKTWLTNNPITFEYVLEEEVIDPYTEAQAEAYNQLMKLMLYKGVNHIWTETDGLEPNLKVTYKQSNNIKNKEQDERLDNLESRLALLE